MIKHLWIIVIITSSLLPVLGCSSASDLRLAPSSSPHFENTYVKRLCHQSPHLSKRSIQEISFPYTDDHSHILITLFTADCLPCIEVIHKLNVLSNTLPSSQVRVIGLCIDPQACPRFDQFSQISQPRFEVGVMSSCSLQSSDQFDGFLIPKEKQDKKKLYDLAAPQEHVIVGVPSSYLIDKEGDIIESFLGPIPLAYVIKLIKDRSTSDRSQQVERGTP